MPYERVHIESVGWVLPDERVTSASIEERLAPAYQRLSIPKGCIEMLTGIVERRFFLPSTSLAERAAEAARLAFRRSSNGAALLQKTTLVISTSVSKEVLEPSAAALVRGLLKDELPPECEAFDVGNACLAFMNGIDTAAMWIEHGRCEVALVVAAESSRRVVEATIARLNQPTSTMQDFKEALPTLTLGSGAVAMVLTRPELSSTRHRVRGAVSLGDAFASTICVGKDDQMTTDAVQLLKSGVALAERTWARAERELSFSRSSMAQFICHQVGATHQATLFQKLGLDLDKAFLTFPSLGNIGPAAVPITLGLAVDAGRVHDGDRLALMGIGSGLSCMMMEVVW